MDIGSEPRRFTLAHGRLEACHCGEFAVRYPDDPSVYSGIDLSRDRSEELKKAEAER